MASLIKLITQCFSYPLKGGYQSISKKDDDSEIEAAKQWCFDYQPDSTIFLDRNGHTSFEDMTKINKYVEKIFNSLQKIPINISTRDIIVSHLDELAMRSNTLFEEFSKKMVSLTEKHHDPEVIKYIPSRMKFCDSL